MDSNKFVKQLDMFINVCREAIDEDDNIELDNIKRKTILLLDLNLGKGNEYSKQILPLKLLDFYDYDQLRTGGGMMKNLLEELKFKLENNIVVVPSKMSVEQEKIKDAASSSPSEALTPKSVASPNNSTKLYEINSTEKSILRSSLPFVIPEKPMEIDLVSIMMPFHPSFDRVLESIRSACSDSGLDCKRVDDIWNNSIVIQDIFELIYCSSIVIVDFSKKNPNVFYEAGIAHTLGKQVIPITQIDEDVPFDLRHHRYIKYLNNNEGLKDLEQKLKDRLKILKTQLRS